MNPILSAAIYLVGAPLVGGLVAGADRILTARLQGRVGPPLLQPFHDVFKLLMKRHMQVTPLQEAYMAGHVVFAVAAGLIFFSGGDFLLVVFALTIASLLLVLSAYAPNSPYSKAGADRELIQMMAYEPLLILLALGFYQAAGSFQVSVLVAHPSPLLLLLPGLFLAFLPVFSLKLRKSPYDLSYSHHAHQELVRGLATELSGRTLAMLELAHWYETVLLLGCVALFFAGWGPIAALSAAAGFYALAVLVDNVHARLTWKFVLGSAWVGTLVLGAGNLLMLGGGH